MALSSVRKRRTRRTGVTRDERTAEAEYRVVFDELTDPQYAETADDGTTAVPQLGDPYSEDDETVVCIGLDVSEVDESGRIFDVTCRFSNKTDDQEQGEGGGGGGQDDPDGIEMKVRFGWAEYEEQVYLAEEEPEGFDASGEFVDIHAANGAVPDRRWQFGKMIVNSAGQQFDPSITKTRYDLAIIITRREREWDIDRQIAFQDSTNSDIFDIIYRDKVFTFGVGTAKMARIEAEATFRDGETWFEAVYEIHYRPQGWWRAVLDEGLYTITNGDKGWSPVLDEDGLPITVPRKLDGRNKVLEESNDPDNPAWPVFLNFKLNPDQRFGDLRLVG